MKKMASFIIILSISVTTVAANSKTITQDKSQLPDVSREFISTHFKDTEISHILVERNLLGIKGYDVILTNGVDIEFDKSGKWTEVDGNHSIIPQQIIPPLISSYIDTHFNGKQIVKIEKEWREYEIKLSNGTELTFNLKGKLIEIDN